MSSQEHLHTKLVEYLQDAQAMEANVLVMLQSLMTTTTDDRIRQHMAAHYEETQAQIERLAGCLDHLGAGGSIAKTVTAITGAGAKGLLDLMRSDKPGRNGRDAYVTEHLEIAAYELLERLAERAGDSRTAEVARENRKEEERMARFIASNWDRFLELTLTEDGISPRRTARAPRKASSTTAATRATRARVKTAAGSAARTASTRRPRG